MALVAGMEGHRLERLPDLLLLAAAGQAEAQQQGEDGAGADAMQSVHGVLLDS